MDHLPVFLNLKGKPALVVGATPSAWRRAAWLGLGTCQNGPETSAH